MNIPYLQSERHFRLYEAYLAEIVKKWPLAVTFTPKAPVASPETLSSRIRIVNQALRANIQSNEELWKTEIPTAKFLLVTDEITVSTTVSPGTVVCGPRDLVRKVGGAALLGKSIEPEGDQIIPKIILVEPKLDLLLAVLTLHHYRILFEPSTIMTTKFHDEIKRFQEGHDIGVERKGNDYIFV